MVFRGLSEAIVIEYGTLPALEKAQRELQNATQQELKVATVRPTIMQYIREILPWDGQDINRYYKRLIAKAALNHPRVLTDFNFLLYGEVKRKSIGEVACELMERGN